MDDLKEKVYVVNWKRKYYITLSGQLVSEVLVINQLNAQNLFL